MLIADTVTRYRTPAPEARFTFRVADPREWVLGSTAKRRFDYHAFRSEVRAIDFAQQVADATGQDIYVHVFQISATCSVSPRV